MYEGLAKSLRTTVMLYGAVGQEDLVTTQLMKQAADAIEELSKRVPPVPHGRLVDADALNDLLMNLADNEYTPKVFASWLSYEENTPTIIPAEE